MEDLVRRAVGTWTRMGVGMVGALVVTGCLMPGTEDWYRFHTSTISVQLTVDPVPDFYFADIQYEVRILGYFGTRATIGDFVTVHKRFLPIIRDTESIVAGPVDYAAGATLTGSVGTEGGYLVALLYDEYGYPFKVAVARIDGGTSYDFGVWRTTYADRDHPITSLAP